MPNDAKLGLVVGVSLVITVAVVFFRKDPAPARPNMEPVVTRPADPTPSTVNSVGNARSHVVQEGETLFSLAQHYYGDMDKFVDLYKANRDVLKSPDQLTPGITLAIPELDTSLAARQ